MPTVTHSIGSAARDYATPTLWEAALPANFVTDGNSQVGQCYNDSEFVISSGSGWSFSAHTTDATHTMTLTTAAGQSFQDQAGVRTNALAYNVSNGVGFKTTANYVDIILLNGVINYITISKIQWLCSNTGNGISCIRDQAGCSNALYKDMIMEAAGVGTGNVGQFMRVTGNSTYVVNILCIIRSTNTVDYGIQANGGNPTLIGCGVVRPSNFTAAATASFKRSYGTPILQSSYSFGNTTASSTGWDATNSKNNATDQTTIVGGSGSQLSVTYSSVTPFVSAADSTRDFRAIASTSLAAAGFLDSTNAPNDISATTRANPPTIGVWEIASAASPKPSNLTLLGAG